jgi:hypothetical protein
MNQQQLLTAKAGPELNLMVHRCLGLAPQAPVVPMYSDGKGFLRLWDIMPLACARMPENDPNYTPERPFLASVHSVQLHVASESVPVAICKAFCLYKILHEPDTISET